MAIDYQGLPSSPPALEYNTPVHYFSEQGEGVEAIVQLAKLLRKEEFQALSADEKTQAFKSLNELALAQTNAYESHAEIAKNIQEFANKVLLNKDIDVTPISQDSPLARDVVFFVKKKDNEQTLLVVKTFTSSSENFLKEINGIAYAEELSLKKSHITKILGVARTSLPMEKEVEDKKITVHEPIFMVAFSVAPGVTVSSIKDNKVDAELEQETFEKLGESLSELHSKNAGTKPREVIPLQANFDKAVENINKYMNDGKDVELKKIYWSVYLPLVKLYLEEVIANSPKEILTGIAHKDAHFGNFLYDPTTKTLSMIDLGELGEGIPTKDYYNVFEHIDAFNKSDAEKDALKEAFKKGYEKGGVSIPSQELFRLIELNNQLEAIGCHPWIDYYPEGGQKMVKAIIKRNAVNLNKSLKIYFKSGLE